MARVRGTQIYSPDILEELKTAMGVESRAGEDDEVTFRQKMNALQRFLNHGMSRFSIDVWHHALSVLLNAHHSHHGNREGHRDLGKLGGVADLRALSRDVIMQREGGALREAETQALKYLDNFLAGLQCLREANACFGDLYKFLHRYYYDPDAGREHSQVRSAQSLSRAHTLNPPNGGGDHVNPFETSARQFGILTLQQMSGSTAHKLRRTVTDMQHILQRWEGVLRTEGEIQAEDLDAESGQDLLLLSGTSSTEHVLRLMPDIFAKFYKCLELAKQWWVLAHDIYPELPINRPPTPSTRPSSRESVTSSLGRGSSSSLLSVTREGDSSSVTLSSQLVTLAVGVRLKEEQLVSLSDELRLLEERERHFESLMEAYEKVSAELDTKTMERKDLVAVREKETFPPNNQMVDPRAKDHMAADNNNDLHDLNEQVARSDREIQLLQFQQSLLRQDYMLQLEVRPSLIRFADDLRVRLQEAQQELDAHKLEKNKVEGQLDEQQNNNYVKTSPTSQRQKHEKTKTNDSSPRSIRSSEEGSPSDVTSHPEMTSAPARNAAADRKLELSRLRAKPLREDTSGSGVVLDTTESRKEKTHPKPRADLKTRKSYPLIKVSKDDEDKTADSSGQPKKSPRLPTIPPAGTGITQSTTEPLFHKRSLQHKRTAITEEKPRTPGADSLEQPVTRPRAKSDPHALQPGEREAKHVRQTLRHLNSVDADKDSERERKNDTTSTKLKPGDSKKTDTGAHKAKPSVIAKDNEPSQKPQNAKKDVQSAPQKSQSRDRRKDVEKTPLTSKSDDVKTDSDTTSQRLRPGELSKAGDKTLHSSKASDARKSPDATPQKSEPNGFKQDSSKMGKDPKTEDTRKDGQRISLGHKTLEEKSKSEAVSSQKSATNQEKPGNKKMSPRTPGDLKTGSTAPKSSKTKEGDTNSRTVNSLSKQPSDKKIDAKSDSKSDDIKKGSDVTSRKSMVSGRAHDVKASLANGVAGKREKHNYAQV
ncbi:microtubule-associated protein futsch-like [Littorina saxatilis]|uniref:microtubule-associated protein futsch-like n=1 Tax=Littorina saxatilis TaxID=31220 RepID=UPI0038B68B9F